MQIVLVFRKNIRYVPPSSKMLENGFNLKHNCDVISVVTFLIAIFSCNFNVDLKFTKSIGLSETFDTARSNNDKLACEKSSIDDGCFFKAHVGEYHNANKRVNYFYNLGNSFLKIEWTKKNIARIRPRIKQRSKLEVARIFDREEKNVGRCKRAAIPSHTTERTTYVTEGTGVINYDDFTDYPDTWKPPILNFSTEYPLDRRHLAYVLPKFTLPTTVDIETYDKMIYTGHEYEWEDIIEKIGTRASPLTARTLDSVERAWETIVWSSEEIETTTLRNGKTIKLQSIWTPYDFNRLKARISSKSSLSAWWAQTPTVKS